MSWLDDLRARKEKHAGRYEVDLNGTTVDIPLKYPTAEGKAEILEKVQAMEKLSKEKNATTKMVILIDEIDRLMLKACIAEGEPTDDELTMLVRESGGRGGKLIPRCSSLLGLDMILNISSTDGGR